MEGHACRLRSERCVRVNLCAVGRVGKDGIARVVASCVGCVCVCRVRDVSLNIQFSCERALCVFR